MSLSNRGGLLLLYQDVPYRGRYPSLVWEFILSTHITIIKQYLSKVRVVMRYSIIWNIISLANMCILCGHVSVTVTGDYNNSASAREIKFNSHEHKCRGKLRIWLKSYSSTCIFIEEILCFWKGFYIL